MGKFFKNAQSWTIVVSKSVINCIWSPASIQNNAEWWYSACSAYFHTGSFLDFAATSFSLPVITLVPSEIILGTFNHYWFSYLNWVSGFLSSVSPWGIWVILFVFIITFAYRRNACLSKENTLIMKRLRQKANKKKHLKVNCYRKSCV